MTENHGKSTKEQEDLNQLFGSNRYPAYPPGVPDFSLEGPPPPTMWQSIKSQPLLSLGFLCSGMMLLKAIHGFKRRTSKFHRDPANYIVEWRVQIQGTFVFFVMLMAMNEKYKKRQTRLATEAEKNKPL